jgi:hypothetical protein
MSFEAMQALLRMNYSERMHQLALIRLERMRARAAAKKERQS